MVMDLRLGGKRALVTGSTAGIGFAAVARLAEEGASVVVNGRSAERVEEAVRRVRERAPGEAEDSGVAADLGTAEGVEELVWQVPEVDVLVNSLGIFEPKDFQEITDDDWFRFFETNVMSGVRLARHYLPGMKERDWGRVVFVSSESEVQIPAEMIHYGMTRTAQLAVARGLAETIVGTNPAGMVQQRTYRCFFRTDYPYLSPRSMVSRMVGQRLFSTYPWPARPGSATSLRSPPLPALACHLPLQRSIRSAPLLR